VRRRRECESCAFRFTTFERIEESLPMVVKKGGQRESFDRYKILSGMKKACEKRPVSVLDLEDATKGIEMRLLEGGDKEVSSQVIGEMVINALREIDQVAYVRFASVYREFSDISEFMDTLRQLASGGASPQAAGKNIYPLRSNRSSETVRKKGESSKAANRAQEELRFNESPPGKLPSE